MRKLMLFTAIFAVWTVSAATYTWNGGTEGNWSDTSNWLCDGAAATTLPTDTDKVNLAGVKATIVLSENVNVGYLWAFQEGTEIEFKSDIVGTKRSLSIKKSYEGSLGGWGGGFPGPITAGTKLVLTDIKLFPNHEGTAASQWGLNTSETRFKAECTIETHNSELYFGKLLADATLYLDLHDSTIWPRGYGTVKGLDVTLDNSQWSGFDQAIAVAGDAYFAFEGTTPKITSVGGTPNPNVTGKLTLHFSLPSAPYATAPLVNDAAVDFAPAGTVEIEIDEDSPAFKSGSLQTYTLMAYEKDASKGLNLTSTTYPTMRTAQEVFTTGYMSGASPSGLPQYLRLTVDGAYDPSSAPLAATFNAPAPDENGERFSGTITELGTGATEATIYVKYGLSGVMNQSAALGTKTAAETFNYLLTGLDPEAEYTYQLSVTNDLGQSVESTVGTFSMLCGSVLSDTVTMTLNNGQGTIAGSLSIIGAGTTTVKLLVGRTAGELAEVSSQEVSMANFSFNYTFADEGDWVVKFICSNTYGVHEWSDTTSVTVRPVSVLDKCTYIWKGGTGNWNDPDYWTCSSVGAGIGRPTSGSEAVFAANTTATVTLPSDISIAKLTPLANGTDVTFVGNNVTLIAGNITAKGNNATLTLDGVKLSDNANVWSIAWKLEPGENSSLRLRNGARIEAKQINPQADSITIDAAGGSSVFFRESWNGNTHSFKLIVDDSTFEVPDKALLISDITFRGTTPSVKVCTFADRAIRLVYELPLEPYASAPLCQSTMVSGSIQDLAAGQATIEIATNSPARIAKRVGTYKLIGWGAKKNDVTTGIKQETVNEIKGLNSADFTTWRWNDGVDPSSYPQHLDVTLKTVGLTIIFR